MAENVGQQTTGRRHGGVGELQPLSVAHEERRAEGVIGVSLRAQSDGLRRER
nr:hypothetical protein Itr_chr01CG01740 [Ipomoea trifida]